MRFLLVSQAKARGESPPRRCTRLRCPWLAKQYRVRSLSCRKSCLDVGKKCNGPRSNWAVECRTGFQLLERHSSKHWSMRRRQTAGQGPCPLADYSSVRTRLHLCDELNAIHRNTEQSNTGRLQQSQKQVRERCIRTTSSIGWWWRRGGEAAAAAERMARMMGGKAKGRFR